MEEAGQEKKGFQPDSDVHIILDDQKKINKFAILHARYNDIQAELTGKRTELKNLEDASEELILMEDNDEEKIPFLYGEVFICLKMSDVQNTLENEKQKVTSEISDLEGASEGLKSVLDSLEVELYAKFGNHIRLGQ